MFKSSSDKDASASKKSGGFFKRRSSGKLSDNNMNVGDSDASKDAGSGPVSVEQESTTQKKQSGMFRRLSIGSKQPSSKEIMLERASSIDMDSYSETRSRSGTTEEPAIQKKSSGFFKRLSIGSKRPSFAENDVGLESASRSEDGSFMGSHETQTEFNVHTMMENMRKAAHGEDGSDSSSVSTVKHSKSKSGMSSLFKKKRKSTNVVLFSISNEFTR